MIESRCKLNLWLVIWLQAVHLLPLQVVLLDMVRPLAFQTLKTFT